jgi:diaminopimelate decarboxylase
MKDEKNPTNRPVPEGKGEGGANRRDCIAAAVAGAAAELGVPASVLAKERLKFARSSCGENKQAAKRVLIAYASKCATTGEVAEAMAGEICAAGAAADVRQVGEVKDLAPYHAVIVGGAARNFSWMAEAVAPKLIQRPTDARRDGCMDLAYVLS